ncbi:hypothetical protein JCM17961_41490 [Endothiovibrio diazotrophicus]
MSKKSDDTTGPFRVCPEASVASLPVNPLVDEPDDMLHRAQAVVAYLQNTALGRQIHLEGEEVTGLYYILEGLHSALRFAAERQDERLT